MLLPRKVEEVLIVVPTHLYDEAVAAVAELGVLHVASPPKVEGGEVAREYRTFYAHVSERVSRLESYFKAVGAEPETVAGIVIEAGGWEEAFEKSIREYKELEEAFERGISRLQEIESKLGELRILRTVLEPISHIEADIRRAYAETAFMGYSIGYIETKDPNTTIAQLGKLAEKHGIVVAVEEVEEDRIAVVAAGSPKAVAGFMQDVRRLKWTPINIPDELPGSPKEAVIAIAETVKNLTEEYDMIVESLRKRLEELKKYYTTLLSIKHAAEILANTVKTRTVRMFRGYVDKADRKKIVKALEKALGGAFMVHVLGVKRAREKVPTKVELPRIIRPFHEIVRMYGEPDPDEVVPTVFLAVTFPLIFGLMFPDAGHGLLVVLFALYFLDKKSMWRPILTILGSVSIVTGFLAGEFFGPVVSEKIGLYTLWEKLGFEHPPLAEPTFAVEHGLGAEVTRTLLFHIVSISLWLAAFMLIFGTLLGFIDALLKGDKELAFASKLPAFIFFTSATLPFLLVPNASEAGGIIKEAIFNKGSGGILQAIVWYGSITGLLWKLFGEPIALAIEGENPLHGLGSAFMEAYEMLAMVLGNVPSFLRILGLGLAHSGLMLGFAKLYYLMAGGGVVGLIAGILVYIFGNLLTAGLEAIIALAHSIRLHFYEWFSKFYSGQGITFTPVRLEGVKIIIRPAL
ncbi:MAG: hypothetical protein F7C35_06460 [Desulfurococcales archaeon]|nr:hypothetical protein [Desulfurococcales archaeon]